MTAGELREMLDGFEDHIPVVVVMPNGTHREITSVENATISDGDGYAAGAGIELGEKV